MLRNGLSASSKALRSVPRLVPLSRPQLPTASPVFLSRPARLAATRWYSDAQATPAEVQGGKAEVPGDKAEAMEQDGSTDAMSELKKALEAQENETKQWKVCFRLPLPRRLARDP